MKVLWTDIAELHLNETAKYIKSKFGTKSFDDFIVCTSDISKRLSVMPSLGRIEPLLSHRGLSCRSITYGKYSKLIYVIEGETISIIDYWNVRQEPNQLADRI